MATPLVPDDLWNEVAPLPPPEPPKPKGGRPRVPDRAALGGIPFVLHTGCAWDRLPPAPGCGGGVTCRRRLRDRQAAGVWDALRRRLLDRLGAAGEIDRSRAPLDPASVPAKRGGEPTGPNPTDRGRPGTKRRPVVEARGVPLAVAQSAANAHDSTLLEAAVDAVPPIRRPSGQRRKRPDKPHADKGDDHRRCRASLRRRGITSRIARKGAERSDRLGRHRWVVERSLAWPGRFRRPTIRYERRADLHHAFLLLACSLICLRRIEGRF